MNIIKRIIESLSKHLEEKDSTNDYPEVEQEKKRKDVAMNIIEIEDEINKAIVNSLNLYKGNDTSKLTLKIIILNSLIFQGLGLGSDSDKIKKSLEEKILEELGIKFQKIKITNEKPESSETVYPLNEEELKDVFYTVEENGDFATVIAVKGYGSIIDEPIKLLAKSDAVYNIGRGKEVKIESSMFRINDIAFNDDENSVDYQKNMHVSRCHAHIQFKKGIGFVLYADKGGTKINGNRTRITRQSEEKPIDLFSDTKNFIPLKDKDIIELGKEALLQFNYKD